MQERRIVRSQVFHAKIINQGSIELIGSNFRAMLAADTSIIRNFFRYIVGYLARRYYIIFPCKGCRDGKHHEGGGFNSHNDSLESPDLMRPFPYLIRR